MSDKKTTHCFERHEDDRGFDEIRLVGAGGFMLRLSITERYKTSGMSGDEWRFSYVWAAGVEGAWVDFDGGYSRMDPACAALYPGLYTSHQEWHAVSVLSADFYSHGEKLYEATYDGDARPLLTMAGHLPWTYIVAGESGACRVSKTLCAQPGCADPWTSLFGLRARYSRMGVKSSATTEYPKSIRQDVRGFCGKHLRRGDCGLDDADSNYFVISGAGPDGGDDHASKMDSPSRVAFV